jgi:molybdenum cofactor biosynthesis enzyme MoaA
MKISTLSIVIGNKACNARCGFCVSRMTGFAEVKGKPILRTLPEHRPPMNFESAVALAKIGGTTTVLLTGKGEPTLAPDEITYFLDLLRGQFPFVELQTNALAIGRAVRDGDEVWLDRLKVWRVLGLNTIAISVVSVRDEQNAEVYHEDYPSLAATVRHLHDLGFTVRLSLMLVRGLVDTPSRLLDVLAWCRKHRVEQLTVRPIRRPENTHDTATADFVRERGISAEQEQHITAWVTSVGRRILRLSHGAEVYDVDGQNVCLTDCLTVPSGEGQIRTLIYYSSGRVAYDWQYQGAVLLGGAE